MATMSVSGLGSNLDVNGIVSQLMSVEKQPITALAAKEASFQAKISAFGSLKSNLSSLQLSVAGMKLPEDANPLDFYSSYKGSVADESIATATATEGAVPGKYSLEVTQLASEHRIASRAGATIGTGTLVIELGSLNGSTTTKTTAINIASSDLNEIRDAINGASAGVTASVVNGKDGPQLVVTGDSGGSENFIKLSGVTGLTYDPAAAVVPGANFVQQQAAQSALLKVNGIAIESQSNTVENALDGVKLELKKTTAENTPTTLTITRDTSSLNKSLEKMVTAFNEFNKLAKELGGLDATTQKLGVLGGDSALRSASSQIRNVLFSVSSTLGGEGIRNLSDIGITLQRDGTLKLDAAKLDKAIATDFAAVANLASDLGTNMDRVVGSLIGEGGAITSKTESIKSSVKTIETRRTELERRLIDVEARYKKQYTSLDSLVSGMLQTSSYLEQQLANLPKAA